MLLLLRDGLSLLIKDICFDVFMMLMLFLLLFMLLVFLYLLFLDVIDVITIYSQVVQDVKLNIFVAIVVAILQIIHHYKLYH